VEICWWTLKNPPIELDRRLVAVYPARENETYCVSIIWAKFWNSHSLQFLFAWSQRVVWASDKKRRKESERNTAIPLSLFIVGRHSLVTLHVTGYGRSKRNNYFHVSRARKIYIYFYYPIQTRIFDSVQWVSTFFSAVPVGEYSVYQVPLDCNHEHSN